MNPIIIGKLIIGLIARFVLKKASDRIDEELKAPSTGKPAKREGEGG